jgi:hypothetical protein
MRAQILEFYLSHHFMYQGWDRSIDKQLLYRLLPYVKLSESEKKIVVFTPSFYNSKNVTGKDGKCLVLVLKQKLIKTGFWCDHPNYLFRKEPKAEFQWLYT